MGIFAGRSRIPYNIALAVTSKFISGKESSGVTMAAVLNFSKIIIHDHSAAIVRLTPFPETTRWSRALNNKSYLRGRAGFKKTLIELRREVIVSS
jgi:hypothetical protein